MFAMENKQSLATMIPPASKTSTTSLRASSLDDILSLPRFDPYVFRSRRRRHRHQQLWHRVAGSQHPLNDKLETENVVTGVAHLCFPKDGGWFQGNLVCSQDCIYRVTGRRNNRGRTLTISQSMDKELSMKTVQKKFAELSGVDRQCFSFSDPSMMSPASSVSFDEDFELADDDFDEEDVYDMEKFSSCGYYTITILDLETGLHYTFERVLVRRGDTDCWASDGLSKQLRYESSQSVIGTSADLLVNSQLGPSFVELGLRVYKGELRFCYKDPVCYPVTVEASQWCL